MKPSWCFRLAPIAQSRYSNVKGRNIVPTEMVEGTPDLLVAFVSPQASGGRSSCQKCVKRQMR